MSYLRDQLRQHSPVLHQALEAAWKIADTNWLWSIPTSAGSYNSAPHFHSIESQLEALLSDATLSGQRKMRIELTPLELYLLLASIMFHDVGRLRGDTNHAYASSLLLNTNPTALGIPTKELARSLARIAIYHDPTTKPTAGENHIAIPDREILRAKNNLRDVVVEPHGRARELYVATLLTLADHLDGSCMRVEPIFAQEPTRIGFKGAFRRLVIGTDYDPVTRCIRTCIDDTFEPVPENFCARNKDLKPFDILQVKGEIEADGNKLFAELTKSANTAPQLYREMNIRPEKPRAFFSKVLSGMVRLKRKSLLHGNWPQDYLLALILRDLGHNRIFLSNIQTNLEEIGIPVDSWLLEFKGKTFNEKGEVEHEPFLNPQFLERVKAAMVDLSKQAFAHGRFTYQTLADHLREPDCERVRLAVNKAKGSITNNLSVFAYVSSWELCISNPVGESNVSYTVKQELNEVSHISLSPAIDQLLNRKTNLGLERTKESGLILSRPKYPNGPMAVTVISGRPGSGKSTLALQILKTSALVGVNSLYLSLEDRPETIYNKARAFGWDTFLHFPSVQEGKDPGQRILNALSEAKQRAGAKANEGVILVGGLLPRPLEMSSERAARYFQEQYKYLESLVKGSASGANFANTGCVRLVVVDSLNMLCYTEQSREWLFRIFDVFRMSGINVIFTVDAGELPKFDSTMADVVFAFSTKELSEYSIRVISVEKSRYTPTSLGYHPYKINDHGLHVLPSLHVVVSATQPASQKPVSPNNPLTEERRKRQLRAGKQFPFGWGPELTEYVVRKELKRPGVVVLQGPNGTRKSTIGVNFLIHGITGNSAKSKDWVAESGILIRLTDVTETQSLSKVQIYPTMDKEKVSLLQECNQDFLLKELAALVPKAKASIRVWAVNGSFDSEVLVEIHFHTGMLLPEEFLDIIQTVCKQFEKVWKKNIGRIVVDDVSGIGGGSYPLLERAELEDLFMSAFVHVMRNERIDVMLVGTRGSLDSANRIVDRAISLADSVIATKLRDVFGERYVLLTGDGMMTAGASARESVPPVLQIVPGQNTMTFNMDLLQGLTGFDSATISRSKVFAYLFKENQEIHEKYNLTLPYLLEPLCGLPTDPGSRLEVISFDPNSSDTIHRSFTVARQRNSASAAPPKEHTVIAMIDEFGELSAEEGKSGGEYFNNVLLIAYRSSKLKSFRQPQDWASLITAFDSSVKGMRIWVDRSANETLSCCLLNCLLSAWRRTNLPQRQSGFKATAATWQAILADLRHPGRIHTYVTEVKAMHNIFQRIKSLHSIGVNTSLDQDEDISCNRSANGDNDANILHSGTLPADADVYICWYSQLRHLLATKRELAGDIRVVGLPSGGFTGDWRICVLDGSVSPRLGKKVVDILTSPDEQYRRFNLGVGLPVGKKWETSEFRAWPGSDGSVLLKTLYKLHRASHQRSVMVPNYLQVTKVLHTFGRRLFGDWDKTELSLTQVTEHLRRLPGHVETLTKR